MKEFLCKSDFFDLAVWDKPITSAHLAQYKTYIAHQPMHKEGSIMKYIAKVTGKYWRSTMTYNILQ
jgi:hypothetical protein